MKLTDVSYLKQKIKGTIILFLFLHSVVFVSAQKYTLNIISNNSNLPKNLKKRNYKIKYRDSSFVFSELQKIRDDLFSKGYISASFDSVVFDSVSVNAFLFAGKKYRINELSVEGISPFLKRKYRLTDSGKVLKATLNPLKLPVLCEQIIQEYENSGYPFASLVPEKVQIKDSAVKINFLLHKNKLIRFNRLIIKGNAHVSAAFLSRYLSLYEGDVYNEELVNSIDSKIKNLTFTEEIRSPEVDFFDNKADVYIYLKKKKANLFNGLIGFIPDKNNDNKLSFTGDINLNLLNNFGKGENIFLKWTRPEKSSQKLDAGFDLPYVFKSPFSLQSNFYLDKRDTVFMKISGKFGVGFSFRNTDKITAFVRKKQSLLLSQSTDTSNFKDSEVLLFGMSYRTEKTDYFFNPSRGYFFDAVFSGGNRKISEEEDEYYEVSIFAAYYMPIRQNFVLKLASDTKYAFPDRKFYENELFDLGGFNSLRGFDENRFKTSAFSVLTLEARYLYERNSNVFAFFNIAGFKGSQDEKTINIPYGFGVGTNLSTKAGIFSISYALGTLSGNYLQFSDSKIHIGYINRF